LNRLHTTTAATIIDTKYWIRNKKKKAANIGFPDELIECAKRFKADAAMGDNLN